MNKERILFIDMWNIMIAMNSTVYIEDHNTYPVGMYIGTINQIRVLIDRIKPTKVICVFDGHEAGERRRQLYPEYKGGRRVKERKSKVRIMEGEDNMVYGVDGAFQNQLIKTFDFLKLLPVTTVILPYAEADDTISYLALKNKNYHDCFIVSNDKDYLQLIQKGISVYRWKEKKMYDETFFKETFKINVENYIFMKIMLGDTSDRVKGITGIGQKTFAKLNNYLCEKVYNNPEHFYELIENLDYSLLSTREKNSFKKVLEQKETFELCYKIMKLDENCLLDEQVQILALQLQEQADKKLARLSINVKMQKTPFNKLYNGFNIDQWIRPFFFLKSSEIIKY